MKSIPFNKPAFVGTETAYLKRCFENAHLAGDGWFTKQCEAFLRENLRVPNVLLTTSCTHALEMSALLLDLQPGDEVIVPSFTFPSTANAFVLRGARPVFADVRPDTLNIDEKQIEKLITPRTKAIIVVHYAGVACEMDEISRIARKHNLEIVEDNAHGLFGKYKNRFLGTFGALATQSFHETKNFSCGEGGALLINDSKMQARAELIREKGTNRSSFFRGEIDKYSWVDVGSSYVMSDLLAAMLFAQFEHKDRIQRQRRSVWQNYHGELALWAEANQVGLPIVPFDCEPAYHLFYLLMPSLEARDRLIEHLKQTNVHSIFHYQPLHLSKMGARFGGAAGACPITERVSDCLLRLPFYNDLSESEQRFVIEQVRRFRVDKASACPERYAA